MNAAHLPLRRRLREHGVDAVTLLVIPAVLFVLALFVYPFLYGLVLSFHPKDGGWLANYAKFFSEPFLYDTIGITLVIASAGHNSERYAVGAAVAGCACACCSGNAC